MKTFQQFIESISDEEREELNQYRMKDKDSKEYLRKKKLRDAVNLNFKRFKDKELTLRNKGKANTTPVPVDEPSQPG